MVFEFNLRHLEAMLAIDRHGGIGAASQAVNLSQPALTQALAKLETQVGHRLFDREPGGARPTAAGRLFLARTAIALQHIAEGSDHIRRSIRLPPVPHVGRAVSMSQLRAISVAEKTGSYTLAARHIGLSQPSVHKAVKELELILGAPLLVREGGTLRATPPAARLVRSVRLALSELRSGLDELAALTLAGAGRLSIGSLPLPKATLLPKALARFSQEHPRAIIRVVEGAYDELLADLREGEIDLIVGALRTPQPVHDIVQRPLFAYNLSVVARAGHPIADMPHPTAEQLTGFPWIVSAPGAPMRSQWEAIFDGIALPERCIESSSILIARQLLLDEDWLALMSPDQFRVEERAGLLVTIGSPVPGSERWIGVTTRANWLPTRAQATFMSYLDHVASRRLSSN